MKPVIRTITGFISTKDFRHLEELIEDVLSLKERCLEAGYKLQTIRITTDILENSETPDAVLGHHSILNALETHESISLFHLGSLTGQSPLTREYEDLLTGLFLKYKKAFMAIDAGDIRHSRILCTSGARMCRSIASQAPFECRRFGVHAEVRESAPFYPASRVLSNSMRFAIGSQCANLAVEEAEGTKGDRDLFEQKLKNRLEKEFSEIENIIPPGLKDRFLGFDTSLAPFPSNEMSIANAIEIVLGRPFGSSGTLSICKILTRVMKENNIRKTGLCGLMLPVVEDNILARRGIEGLYTLKELLLYSSVCATGLDAIPIAGSTPLEDLADCYNDLVTLSARLQKPLSARFFLEPEKEAGETVKYDWEFACESPVFQV